MVYTRLLCTCAVDYYTTHSTANKKYHKLKITFLLGFSQSSSWLGERILPSFLRSISPPHPLFLGMLFRQFFVHSLLLWGLLKAFDRLSHSIAWIYLLASSVKFILFIFWLWPLFKADGIVSSLERFSFFIPYLTGLVLETGILIFKLNKI